MKAMFLKTSDVIIVSKIEMEDDYLEYVSVESLPGNIIQVGGFFLSGVRSQVDLQKKQVTLPIRANISVKVNSSMCGSSLPDVTFSTSVAHANTCQTQFIPLLNGLWKSKGN